MDILPKFYFKPWTRSGPYALGIILAFVMHKLKKPKLPIPVVLLTWIVAIGTGLTVVYIRWMEVGEGVRRWSKSETLAYYTLYRPAWGLFICWVIWACHNGYGGIINKFLSMRIFVPLSRISFGIYLFHWSFGLSYIRAQSYTREFSILNMVNI